MFGSKDRGSTRREYIGQIGALGLSSVSLPLLAMGSAIAQVKGASLIFAAYRNGDYLGLHRVDFSGSEERLVVDIEIAFDVKLAFIPLYRYRHKNRELWERGRLISLDSETDDNGDSFRVKARADGDRLIVDGSGGRLDLPGNTQTTSYWNEDAMTKGEWLGTQEGQIARSIVTKKPAERVQIKGQAQMANRYDLDGDLTCSLWYADGRWAKLLFFADDGSEIAYAIETPK